MAVTKDDLLISIEVQAGEAKKSIDEMKKSIVDLSKTQEQSAKSTEKISASISGLGATLIVAQAAIDLFGKAWDAVSEPIAKAIAESNKAQTAFDKFSLSLKFFGGGTAEKAASDIRQITDELESLSGIDAEQLLDVGTRGASLGLTVDQVKQLTKATSELAALMGGDAQQAGQALLGTLVGQTRAVARYVPELKTMTQAQLESGKGIEIVASKLSGLGQAFGTTVAGIQARYTQALGNVFESIGNLINEFFGLNQLKASKIPFFESLTKQIDAMRAPLMEFKAVVVAVYQTLKGLDWEAIAIAVGVVVAAFNVRSVFAQFETSIFAIDAAFKMLTSSLMKFLIPYGLIALKTIAITAAIAGTIAIVEILYRNFDKLGVLGEFAFLKIEQGILKARILWNEWMGDAEEAKTLTDRLASVGKEADALSSKLDFGITGRVFDSIGNAVSGFSDKLDEAKTSTNGLTSALNGLSGGVGSIRALSEEAQNAYDSIKALASASFASAQSGGQNEQQAIRAKAAEQGLKAEQAYAELAKKTSDTQVLAEAQRLVGITKVNNAQQANLEIAKKQEESARALRSANDAAALSIQNFGALQREQIENNLKASLEAIKKERKARLEAAGEISAQEDAEYERKRALAKQAAEQQSSNAPSKAFEGLQKSGQDIGKEISGQFSEGMMGSLMGFISGVQAVVSAAQAVVDAGPQLLESIASLINSVTDLPLKLMEGVQHIFQGLERFLSEFVNNIGTMIIGILDAVVGFIEKIPELLVKFITDIPKMLMRVIEALPGMIERLITALVEAAPMIALGLIEFMIKDAPRLALKLMEVIAIKLPIAIVKGIVNGIKNIVGAIKRLFTGGAVFEDAGKSIMKGVSSGFKKLSGIGSRLFEVKDLAEGALGGAADKAGDYIKEIEEAGSNAFDSIIQAWKWVQKNIIDPLWNYITGIFSNVFNSLKIVFAFVVDMLKIAWENLKAVFQFAVNLFMAVWNFAKNIFIGVINLFKALFEFGKKMFTDPVAAFEKLWDDLKNIFSDALDNFSQFFDDIGNAVGDFGAKMWEGFQASLSATGNFFSDLGNNIWEGLKSGLGTVVSFFNNLFSFEGGGTGAVEDFFGFDFPFFAFAQGGKVPGYAPSPGDSDKNDIVPALLSPGEMVMPRTIVDNPAYKKILEMMFSGKEIPMLSWFDDVVDTVSSVVSSGVSTATSVLSGVIPGPIMDMFNSILRFSSDIDLGALLSDPVGEVKRIIEDYGKTFLQDPFRQLLDNFPKMAEGGLVTGGISGMDSVPSMLMPGEFVMNRNAVQSLGLGNLSAMNSGQQIGSSYVFNLEIKIENKDPMDENFLRNRLMPRLQDELKRASMDGRFVVSQRGVRTV